MASLLKSAAALAAVLGLSIAATSASAAIVFEDDFEGLSDVSRTNFNGFSQWSVDSASVDLVKSGDFSIACDGFCVDLDGSTRTQNGTLFSSDLISFAPGMTYTLSFDYSGGQREEYVGLAPSGAAIGTTDAFVVRIGDFFEQAISSIAQGDGFVTVSFLFSVASAVDARLSFANTGPADFVGALVDNISISSEVAEVPLPGALPLLLSGLIGLGIAKRKKSA